MAMTPDRPCGGAPALVRMGAQRVRSNDINSEWLDQMVKRLFKELEKQLARVEATRPDDNDPKKAAVRAANVRTLGAIERTLERLARLEQQRIASRKIRTAAENEEKRADLIRRLDKLLANQSAQERSAEPQE